MTDTRRLETVSVDRPCPKKWAELVGDEKRRYCSACDLHVTNLSAMTRAEGEAFLAGSEGRVCVTYLPSSQGGATSVEHLARPTRRSRLAHALSRAAGFLVGALFLLPGCRPAAPEVVDGTDPDGGDPDGGELEHPRLLGEACVEPESPIEHTGYVMGDVAYPEGWDDEPRIVGRIAPPLEIQPPEPSAVEDDPPAESEDRRD